MGYLPFVSIVMPSYNEEVYIEKTLQCFLDGDYPKECMEILVADGGSTDTTKEIICRLAAVDPRIIIIDNSKRRIQSAGMNLGIKHAKGDYILIADVHAEYAPNYVRKIIEVFEKSGADDVGGAARPKAKNPFQRALCAALMSPLGVGNAAYRYPDKEGFVDTVFPGSFRRSILEKVGLYDTAAVTNEDAELAQRILQAGGTVYLSREIEAYYYPRSSFSALARQYYRYGQGRARTFVIHKRFPTIRPLVPFFGVATTATMLAVPPLYPFLLLFIIAYIALTGFESIRLGYRSGPRAIPTVWLIFPILHFSHGLGFAFGLLRQFLCPQPPAIETLDSR